MSDKPVPSQEYLFLPVRGTVDVDRSKGSIDLGDGCHLIDIPRTGRMSIIWQDLGDGAALVDYEAMEQRDAATGAAVLD